MVSDHPPVDSEVAPAQSRGSGEPSRDELAALREENRRLRAENVALREAGSSIGKLHADLLALIESTDDALLFADADGKPLVFNSTYARIMKELLGIDMRPGFQPHTLLDQQGRDFWEGMHRRVLAGEKFKAEFPFEHGGRTLHFEVAYHPVYDGDQVVGFSEFTREITERKRLEEQLRIDRDRSQEDYRLLFESMLDGYAVHQMLWNEDGSAKDYRFLATNPAFERLTGLPFRQVIGQTVREVLPGIEDSWIERYGEVTRTGEPSRFEQHAEELDRHYEVMAFRTGPDQFATVFRDVTLRHRLEEERNRAQRLESIGLLAGGIAHDFNNILASLLAAVQLTRWDMEARGLPVPMLHEAEAACKRAGSLTKQLLTFARGGEPVKRQLQLAHRLREWTEFALRGSSVEHRVEVSGPLWAVEADEGQISQVIHNIVLNAAQASEEGATVTVRAENVTLRGEARGGREATGRHLRITVVDTGCGIPSSALPKIFDPYFSTKPGGTGLGLAASYSIVKRHGGHLAVVSEEGRGSTFEVLLPGVREAGDAEEGTVARPARGSGRILFMDDDEQLRRVVARSMRHFGYEVDVAEEGERAIELFRRSLEEGERYDVVILDLTVPGGKGGRATLEALHEIDPEVRAVVSSGYSNDLTLSRAQEHGFRGVLSKPFRLEELAATIARVMQS